MTTPEQAASLDAQNMEHLGEWDHGVEPDAMMDGEQEQEEEEEAGEPKDDNKTKPTLMKKAKLAATTLINNVKETSRKVEDQVNKALHDDAHLKEGVESHTEEEVAGMKLCVSKTVHQDSFIAQC